MYSFIIIIIIIVIIVSIIFHLFVSLCQNLYGIKTTGLRFFTVYGPYGRPDMAYFSFSNNIMQDKPIQIYVIF